MSEHDHDRDLMLHAGTRVEVRGRFMGNWARGFEVATTTARGYLVRRTSDRCVLPAQFDVNDVRPAG
jgi:hypothetical protein